MERMDLFKELYRRCSGYIELRALPSKKIIFISLGTDWLTIRKQIDKFCQKHKDQHIYFGIATRDGKGGTEENVISIPCVWVEMDYKDIPKGKVQETIDKFPFKPSIIVKTGGGVHLYFLLDKPVDLKRSSDVRKVNDLIRSELCKLGKWKLDNVGDIARVFRLPDTVNHKYEHKPLCQVVEINDTTHKLKDFLEKVPVTVKKDTNSNDKHEKVASSELEIRSELLEQVEDVTAQIERKKLILGDDSYDNWLRIGFALADGLKEAGRTYFHRISIFSEKYDVHDCDNQYDKCLNEAPPEGRITIDTFFYYARRTILNEKKPESIKGISVSELMLMEFPEPMWIVPSIIPEGLSILCGKPKIGKSILSVNLAVAVATGGMALGKISVERSGVLYLALEDTPKRLQKRLKAVLQGCGYPENLFIDMSFKSIKDGGIEQLNSWLKQHKEVGFVIIDTYVKIKGQRDNSGDLYLGDYKEIVKIKEVADRHNIGILLIHHTRKEVSEDVFDTVLGTTGITGAADTIIILDKNKGTVNLHVRGRDVEEAKFSLKFDNITLSWILYDEMRHCLTPERKEIVDLLKPKEGSMKLKDIATALNKEKSNVNHMLNSLIIDGVLEKTKYGEYAIKAS